MSCKQHLHGALVAARNAVNEHLVGGRLMCPEGRKSRCAGHCMVSLHGFPLQQRDPWSVFLLAQKLSEN
jgi:hypothetical protein